MNLNNTSGKEKSTSVDFLIWSREKQGWQYHEI